MGINQGRLKIGDKFLKIGSRYLRIGPEVSPIIDASLAPGDSADATTASVPVRVTTIFSNPVPNLVLLAAATSGTVIGAPVNTNGLNLLWTLRGIVTEGAVSLYVWTAPTNGDPTIDGQAVVYTDGNRYTTVGVLLLVGPGEPPVQFSISQGPEPQEATLAPLAISDNMIVTCVAIAGNADAGLSGLFLPDNHLLLPGPTWWQTGSIPSGSGGDSGPYVSLTMGSNYCPAGFEPFHGIFGDAALHPIWHTENTSTHDLAVVSIEFPPIL